MLNLFIAVDIIANCVPYLYNMNVTPVYLKAENKGQIIELRAGMPVKYMPEPKEANQ